MIRVYLSFDIEEFDVPDEFGHPIPFSQKIAVSQAGTHRVLDVLKAQGVQATFFSTVTFAEQAPDVITRLLQAGHELASHGVHHSAFEEEHLQESRERLTTLAQRVAPSVEAEVVGFRMPRMQPVLPEKLLQVGYSYDASLNPTYIPGRYNHWGESRVPYRVASGLLELPASVTPLCRFPLFWLMLHHMPASFFRRLLRYTGRKMGYVNLYFHPWEFVALGEQQGVEVPRYIARNTGNIALQRLESLIKMLHREGAQFVRCREALHLVPR